jgi:two-component system, OmpR family, sensor histidine kinase BaeS
MKRRHGLSIVKKSLFLRLFASIMAITVIILVVQVLAVVSMFNRQSRDFEQDVFDKYTMRLQEALDGAMREKDIGEVSSIGPILQSVADDRISGLILYDGDGNTVLTYGKTPRGAVLPDVEPFETEEVSPDQSLLHRQWYLAPTFSKLYVNIDDPEKVSGIVISGYPDPVRKQDVVGRVILYADADRKEVFGSVDVLVFSPMTYQLTAMILRRMLSTFYITIPIALIIALLGSHMIGRSIQRNAKRVAQALEAVSKGDYTNTVPHSSLRELEQISDSVDILGSRLKSHEHMRQQWLQSIAHDLNTPVTALKVSIEGALDGVFPLDVKLLGRLKKENDELERRVASVMMLSAMEAPDFTAKMEPIDVLEFVDNVVNSSLSQRKVSLDLRLEKISGDRRLLEIVCRELLKNAEKYSPQGTAISWRIIKGSAPNNVCMEISNTGDVPSELLEQVFQPWFRVDLSRSRDGSGMGLSIVRQVMELHHGTATMEQRGAQIVVVLQW